MTTLANSLISASSRPVRLRMRPDLTARRQRYQGKGYWVVKEPVGLNYFRFQEEEYAVLEMLDGERSLEEIQELFQKRFPPQKITLPELQQFIGMLHGNGLLIAEAPRQGQQLKTRSDEKWYKEFFGAISNVLALRFKGIDPDPILNFLNRYTWWFWTWPATIAVLVYGFAALMLVLVNWETFQSKLPTFHEFFGPHNWIWLMLVLGAVKVLHEFGHGLSCKYYGGECHEMGVMLLVLTPCLYCNVSDSWMLPNKWHRAMIGAAGMYVELVIAATATFIWWFSEPGLLNFLALRVMFICSVSTVFFNGNPLLRYDGYYILSDIAEIPNLQQKSSDVLRHLVTTHCLGMETPEDPFLPQENQFLFALYTVASTFYRWLVFFSILMLMNHIFEPYGLKIIGQLIAVAGIFGLVVMPIVQMVQFFNIPGRLDQVKSTNVLATLGVVAAIVAFILFVPLPSWIKAPVEIRPADAVSVFVSTPGKLAEQLVKPGEYVEKGRPLARLESLDLELMLAEHESRLAQQRMQLESLEKLRFEDPSAALQIPTVLEGMKAVEEQIATTKSEIERLTIVAPVSGTVLHPAHRSRRGMPEEQLPGWLGSPLSTMNLGAYLQASDLLCQIGDPTKLEAVAVIDQADVELVRTSDVVEVKLDGFAADVFTSQLAEIARVNLKVSPTGLTNEAGYELATKADSAGRQRPLNTSYQARVPLDNADETLRVGMRGRMKVYSEWKPLWHSIWRYLTQTFNFRL